MSDSQEESAESAHEREPRDEPGKDGRKLTRRGWTVLFSGVLVLVFALLGVFIRVPYVVLGPGPTYDTLGQTDGKPVIQIGEGVHTYPTSGELRMTTVSLNDEVTLFGALGLWLSGNYALAPYEAYFPPGQTEKEVRQHNAEQFRNSQSNAEVAALRKLGYDVKVVVQEVLPGSPAEATDLAAGQRVVKVEGTDVSTAAQLQQALADTRPGQQITLTVAGEDGNQQQVTVPLGKHPDPSKQQGYIGIQPADRAAVPFNVDISLEDVGGPSAGLIFSLGIYDELTEGALVDGKHVAGTGTISPTGVVGEIGGIQFKLEAAREAGANTFLVPEGNCAQAAAAAPDGLRLIRVHTLDEAITALEDLQAGRPTASCTAG